MVKCQKFSKNKFIKANTQKGKNAKLYIFTII